MATLVQEVADSGGGANSTTLTLNTASTAGNFLVVYVVTSSNSGTLPTISGSSGWNSAVVAQNSGSNTAGQQTVILYKFDSIGGSTGDVFNFSNSCNYVSIMQEWNGIASSAQLDQTATNTTTGTTVTTGTTGTTAHAHELAVYAACWHSNTVLSVSAVQNSYVFDTTMGVLSSGAATPTMNIAIFSKELTSTGTTSSGFTLSGTPPGGGGATTTALATFVEVGTNTPTVSNSAAGSDSPSIILPGGIRIDTSGLGAEQLVVARNLPNIVSGGTGFDSATVQRINTGGGSANSMTDYFSNFASTTVAYGAGGPGTQLAATDTTLHVATGDGAKFPSSFPFRIVLGGAEIAKVTARSTDTLTLVRGQEGTTAQNWAIGSSVQHGATAGNLTNIWTRLNLNQVSVQEFGAVGDGSTDDASAIQAAINACPTGGVVWFPGTGHPYIIGTGLVVPDGIELAAPNNSVMLKMKNGSNLAYMVANTEFVNNNTFVGQQISIRSLGFDGNSANNPSGGHAIVLSAWISQVRDCYFQNIPQTGIVITDRTANGSTLVSGSVIENRIQDNKITGCGQYGIWVTDYNHKCTDGWCLNNVVDSTTNIGINIERASGWFIMNNHVYNAQVSAYHMGACFTTYIISNEVDGFGQNTVASGQWWSGIDIVAIEGRATIVADNVIATTEANNNCNYQYISGQCNGASGETNVIIYGNEIAGVHTSSPNSIGLALGTSAGQQATNTPAKFLVYGNSIHGCATESSIDAYSQKYMPANHMFGQALIEQHLLGGSTLAPTAAAGANDGGTPPAPVVVSGSSDTRGKITFGTGTAPAAGAMVVVTFSTAGRAYTTAPTVVISPANSATAALQPYVSAVSTTSFTVSFGSAPAASQANTVYAVNYFVMG